MIDNSGIYEVLERAGIERARPKMVCSKCGARKVTASVAKGIARCWGCLAFWSVAEDENVTPPEQDWATYMLAKVAEEAQEHLPHCRIALDWLEFRGVPIDDIDWMIDHDLGAVIDSFDIRGIVSHAGLLLGQQKIRLKDQATKALEEARGKGVKAQRVAERRAAEIDAEIVAEEQAFQHISTAILPKLTAPEWSDAVMYIYRDADGNPTSLNIRQVESEPEERKVIRVQPRSGKRGVFGAQNAEYRPGEGWKDGMPALTIVEGEHNLLSMYATIRFWGLQYDIPMIAIGGKNGADIDCIRKLTGDTKPCVIYDNDKRNVSTGRPGGYELVEAVSSRLYCYATTTPTKDLDDYLKSSPSITPTKLRREVFDRAVAVPLDIDHVRAIAAILLTKEGVEANAREIAVTDLIVSDVKRRTSLYHVDGYALLLRPDGESRSHLISVRSGDPSFQALMREYGISRKDWVEACGKAINAEASKLSTPRRTVHSLAHWTGARLYINCYDGSMVRICVEGDRVVIDRVPVGTDDVIMWRYAVDLSDTTAPVRPWLREDTDLSSIATGSMKLRVTAPLTQKLLGCVNYEGSAEHHMQILKSWLLSIFFSSTHLSRPIPIFEGVPGGGKSAMGLQVGTLLLGPQFRTTNVPTTPNELAEFMTSKPFVAFDEWDTTSKPVENAFKHLTTGGKHSRRELYTTSTVVELPCDAAVMLTTNSNPIRQTGSSRRFLVIPVAARQKSIGEEVYQSMGEHVIPGLMATRADLWLELLSDLAACVLALHKTDAATRTSFSMADFGVFVQRVADFERWGDDARKLFARAEETQEAQAAESQVLFDLLTELLFKNPKLQAEHLQARQWADHLQEIIPEYDYDRKRKVNTSYIGWVLKTNKDLYCHRLRMSVVENRHTKVKTYAFSLAPVTAGGATV